MGSPLFFGVPGFQSSQPENLSKREMSLNKRYAVASVNDVMRDNILLTIAYMRNIVPDKRAIDWETVRKPFTYSFELQPGETYAFQKDALDEFKGTVTKTTDVHFGASDGFKSDGYLFGDGVCHLASLFYWAAKDAGLHTVAPTNHDFAIIPEIPREYGVSIYSQPGQSTVNATQNLYVKNDSKNSIRFDISYDGNNLKVEVVNMESTAVKHAVQEII